MLIGDAEQFQMIFAGYDREEIARCDFAAKYRLPMAVLWKSYKEYREWHHRLGDMVKNRMYLVH